MEIIRKYDTSGSEVLMPFKEIGLSNREMARQLGVCEGTIRYRLKKVGREKGDGRKNRPSTVSRWEQVIGEWVEKQLATTRPKTVKALYTILNEFHNYRGSYDALLRYVRKRYPQLFPAN